MERWLVYFRERFPMATYLLLSFGIGAQATIIAAERFDGAAVCLGTLLNLLFFAVLRLMDEVKDVRKDQIAHPERPLARGLIGISEAKQGIHLGLAGMVFSGLAMMNFTSFMSGLFYLFTTLYLWLMYKEFFIGGWLGKRPILYAVTHQLILLPLVASQASLAPKMLPGVWEWSRILLGGLQILPAFFTYEVARKLDPSAHPILETYRTVYGPRKYQMILFVLAGFALGVMLVALNYFPFISVPSLVIGSLLGLSICAPFIIYVAKGDSYAKKVEIMATINLLLSMYTPVFVYGFLALFRGQI